MILEIINADLTLILIRSKNWNVELVCVIITISTR